MTQFYSLLIVQLSFSAKMEKKKERKKMNVEGKSIE